MTIKEYIKKPIKFTAVQWTGDNYGDIASLVGSDDVRLYFEPQSALLKIQTLIDDETVSAGEGEWVLRYGKDRYDVINDGTWKAEYEEA